MSSNKNPDLYLNEATGELTCVEHGGASLRAAVMAAANPHSTKPFWSPFGNWYYVDALTKREFMQHGMGAPECETCKYRKTA